MSDKRDKIKYSRHLLLSEIGEIGQKKLAEASVLVVGAGGLGCPVLQYLAAAGVGKIHIIDGDRVEESNLQRQVLYDEANIGKPKAEVAATKLRKQNSLIAVHSYCSRLARENVSALFQVADIIVDCSDNFGTRYLISDAATLLGKPVVYGAVDRFQGQVTVFSLHPEAPTYRCLFPVASGLSGIQNCSETGVLGVVPGIIGMIQATEVIKIICGFGEVLTGKVLFFDALNMQTMQIGLEKNPETIKNMPADIEELMQWDYELICDSKISTISAAELYNALQRKERFSFLDVREEAELPEVDLLSGHRIPLSVLESRFAEIDPSRRVVVYCKSGRRSAIALQLLSEKYGFAKCIQLDGGIDAWLQFEMLLTRKI